MSFQILDDLKMMFCLFWMLFRDCSGHSRFRDVCSQMSSGSRAVACFHGAMPRKIAAMQDGRGSFILAAKNWSTRNM